jgi:hypothetical protein
MYGDLIPAKLQNELIAIRDSSTRQCWRIADICAEVVEWNRANGQEIEMQQVYAAVGLFAGKASRTVREYHFIGRFFQPEIRETFECLAFDHFRHAAQLGDRAIEALQWAVEQTDELNRPATVDAMMAKFALPEPGQPDQPGGEGGGEEGIYSTIFRNCSTQAMAAERWLGYELSDEMRDVVHNYWQACLRVVKSIPQESD